MNRFLKRTIDKHMPRENEGMVEGMAHTQSSKVLKYVSAILDSFGRMLPKELEYMGYELVSPEEEFFDLVAKRYSKITYELSKSDLFLIKFKIRWGDELFENLLYLPYIGRGNSITIGGTSYIITPILSDYVISILGDNIFVKLLKDKLLFNRTTYNVSVNGQVKLLPMVISDIHHNKLTGTGIRQTTKASATIVHYFLCKFGYTGMWKKLKGFVPAIGRNEINEDNYPPDKYTIYAPSSFKPKGYLGPNFIPPFVRIAVENDKIDHKTEQLISGLFYVFDQFSDKVKLDMIDNERLWMVFLGHIYYTGNFSIDKLYGDISDHFASLEDYIDEFISEKLYDAGYKVKDFYGLLETILDNIPKWTANHKEINESVYYRYADVLYYILYSVTIGIFKAGRGLAKLSKDNKLNRRSIETMLRTRISQRNIFDLVKNKEPNLAVLHVEYSSDNLYPKMTAMMNVQEMGDGVKRARNKRELPKRLKTIFGTETVVGSMFYLPKKTPSPLFRLNMFASIDANTGKIKPSKETREATDEITKLLAYKFEDEDTEFDDIEVEQDMSD